MFPENTISQQRGNLHALCPTLRWWGWCPVFVHWMRSNQKTILLRIATLLPWNCACFGMCVWSCARIMRMTLEYK